MQTPDPDAAPTTCEPCFVDMAAAWDEISPEEQAATLAELEEARRDQEQRDAEQSQRVWEVETNG